MILQPILALTPRLETRGRPRKPDRDVLEGVLWILKTGAQWNELPRTYPPYQTCHRRYQEWVNRGVFKNMVDALAHDMEERGNISLRECFIDGTFSSAKRGVMRLAPQNAEKVAKSWQFRTKVLFQSPSIWPLLLPMRSPWWRRRLPKDLPKRIRLSSWATKRTIPMGMMPCSLPQALS